MIAVSRRFNAMREPLFFSRYGTALLLRTSVGWLRSGAVAFGDSGGGGGGTPNSRSFEVLAGSDEASIPSRSLKGFQSAMPA
jgi:hypothetical protein